MHLDGVHPFGTYDDEETLRQFARQSGITFPILTRTERHMMAYQIGMGPSPYPLEVVIDRDGLIAYTSRDYDADALVQVIESVLAQPGGADP
jgi:peroxiredoxin